MFQFMGVVRMANEAEMRMSVPIERISGVDDQAVRLLPRRRATFYTLAKSLKAISLSALALHAYCGIAIAAEFRALKSDEIHQLLSGRRVTILDTSGRQFGHSEYFYRNGGYNLNIDPPLATKWVVKSNSICIILSSSEVCRFVFRDEKQNYYFSSLPSPSPWGQSDTKQSRIVISKIPA